MQRRPTGASRAVPQAPAPPPHRPRDRTPQANRQPLPGHELVRFACPAARDVRPVGPDALLGGRRAASSTPAATQRGTRPRRRMRPSSRPCSASWSAWSRLQGRRWCCTWQSTASVRSQPVAAPPWDPAAQGLRFAVACTVCTRHAPCAAALTRASARCASAARQDEPAARPPRPQRRRAQAAAAGPRAHRG